MVYLIFVFFQDSGFSDNENFLTSTNTNISNKPTPDQSQHPLYDEVYSTICERSPSMSSEIATPPTVIRNKGFKETEYHVGKKLTFSAPNSPVLNQKNLIFCSQIDSLVDKYFFESLSNETTPEYPKTLECLPNQNERRPVNLSSKDDSSHWAYTPTTSTPDNKTYNNETVVLGHFQPDSPTYETEKCQIEQYHQLPTYSELFSTNSSTPRRSTPLCNRSLPNKQKCHTSGSFKYSLNLGFQTPEESLLLSAIHFNEYTNPLLNGHTISVQVWLDETKVTCYNEVMSTLQTKSIAVEPTQNLKIASFIVLKTVRSVQEQALNLQREFEKCEKVIKMFPTTKDQLLVEMSITNLVRNIGSFLEKIISKYIYQAENENDLAKFEDNIDNILDMASEIRKKVLKFRFEDLYEDILIIKRHLLIVIHSIFDKLIRIIINNLEESKCQLILKSNLSYIGLLSDFCYNGFASLTDAFYNNGAIRILLVILLKEKMSEIRALALRALATVCSSVETISQFEQAEGLHVIKDIITGNSIKKTEAEIREAISVLTQITAPWHGADYKIESLKNMVETLVESITKVLQKIYCPQTILLCAACLNNLSRLEVTAVYSLMANETILTLRNVCQSSASFKSIFFCEQLTSMVFNMSLNKKSHHHLTDKLVISFLVTIFDECFHTKYYTYAENEALKRTIKNLLHIFSRLIHESNLGYEILANNMVPFFSHLEKKIEKADAHHFKKDISYINRKLNESLNGSKNGFKLYDTRSEKNLCNEILKRHISYI